MGLPSNFLTAKQFPKFYILTVNRAAMMNVLEFKADSLMKTKEKEAIELQRRLRSGDIVVLEQDLLGFSPSYVEEIWHRANAAEGLEDTYLQLTRLLIKAFASEDGLFQIAPPETIPLGKVGLYVSLNTYPTAFIVQQLALQNLIAARLSQTRLQARGLEDLRFCKLFVTGEEFDFSNYMDAHRFLYGELVARHLKFGARPLLDPAGRLLMVSQAGRQIWSEGFPSDPLHPSWASARPDVTDPFSLWAMVMRRWAEHVLERMERKPSTMNRWMFPLAEQEDKNTGRVLDIARMSPEDLDAIPTGRLKDSKIVTKKGQASSLRGQWGYAGALFVAALVIAVFLPQHSGNALLWAAATASFSLAAVSARVAWALPVEAARTVYGKTTWTPGVRDALRARNSLAYFWVRIEERFHRRTTRLAPLLNRPLRFTTPRDIGRSLIALPFKLVDEFLAKTAAAILAPLANLRTLATAA